MASGDISDFLTCKTVFLVQVLLDLLLAFSVNRAVGNRRYKVRHLHFSDRGIAEFISIDSFQEMRQFLSHSMVVGGSIILQDGIKNRRNRKPVETRFAICMPLFQILQSGFLVLDNIIIDVQNTLVWKCRLNELHPEKVQ